MTTIDDKLKLFAEVVFQKVQEDSEQKVVESTKEYDVMLNQEKENVLKQSENMVKQMKKKAEAKKSQIISKANIDSQHVLLKKRKEIFDRVIEDIRKLAANFTNQPEYISFLEKCIANALSQMHCEEVVLFFKEQDLNNYKKYIDDYVCNYKKPNMNVSVDSTDKNILGGCICEDRHKTIRIDCSMASIIGDNRAAIGKTLMDNLQ